MDKGREGREGVKSRREGSARGAIMRRCAHILDHFIDNVCFVGQAHERVE
jgi:hypothetical protein